MPRLRPLCLLALLATPALAGPSDEVALPPPEAVSAEVDALMEQVWKEKGIEPAKPASDAELLRRMCLDLHGVIPEEERVRAFLGDKSRAKRQVLVRALLEEEAFARFSALRWSYLLVGREYLFKSFAVKKVMDMRARRQERMEGMEGGTQPGADEMDGEMEPRDDRPVPPLTAWLEDRLRENAPWDQVVRQVVAAQGTVEENPAGHYLVRHLRDGKAEELAGSSMRLFQGLQIQCAQCHDHPYTAWSQHDFYGVAAFFSRAAARRVPDPDAKNGKGGFEVLERPDGQIRIAAPPGERGQMVLPRFTTGQVIPPGKGVARREELGKLLTSPENPWFAKAMVNRFWSFLFGRGIVTPVDDLEVGTSLHPQVLERLARDFRDSGHDVRRLVEVMLLTRAYQLGSAGPVETRAAQQEALARMPLRQLSAEQLFYSVMEATGTGDARTRSLRERARLERTKVQLLRQFLQTFADDEAEEVVEEGTIPQALLLLNGPVSNEAVRPRPGHPLFDRLFKLEGLKARAELVWVRFLGRQPTPDELRTVEKLFARPDGKTAAAQAQGWSDVMWALLNSPEFSFNH